LNRSRWFLRRRTKPRVVFVVQWLETFEMVRPVWEALRRGPLDPTIVFAPERDMMHWVSRDGNAYDMDLAERIWRWLRDHGYSPEPLLAPEEEADRLRDWQPVAVFLPTPYPEARHPSLDPVRLGLPVHYVNYAFDLAPPGGAGIQFELPFFRQCEAIYAENEYCADQFRRAGVRADAIVDSGPPILDYWDVPEYRSPRPSILWCPWWSVRHGGTENATGYSTFLLSYEAVLSEAVRRPHMDFVFRPHPMLWSQLRADRLWSPDDERRFLDRAAALPNFSVVGAVTPNTRLPWYPDHISQFRDAWAMVTDGISFLAEFAYTGKPLLLTEAPGNPGWNPVGQAIASVVTRSSGIAELQSFLDGIERDEDPDRDTRRRAVHAQFFRPPGGSGRTIANRLVAIASRSVT